MVMSALTYLLGDVHRTIPKQILQATFGPGGPNGWSGNSNIDKVILDEVWVHTLREVNSISGKYKLIVLDPRWKIRTVSEPMEGSMFTPGYYAGIYLIPPHARDYGNIVAVEKVDTRYSYNGIGGTQGSGGYGGNYNSYGNNEMNLASAALSSRTLSPYTFLPRGYMIDHQTIKLTPDDLMMASNLEIHCLISFDNELTNIDISLLNAIRSLFICDVKTYIYNTLDIPINETEVSSGSELSRFKERVSEYAGAMDERAELIDEVAKAKYFDPELMHRLNMLQV